MLRKLFSFSPKKDPDELLKLATQKKKEGDLDEAISMLKEAYKMIGKSRINYGIQPFLRLPNYLQLAGKNDEAWSEFNKLLVKGYPNQINDLGLMHMEQSKIYDSMRLFLQKEGKFEKAVIFHAMYYLTMAKGLYLQKRPEDAKKQITVEKLRKSFSNHLKKADVIRL